MAPRPARSQRTQRLAWLFLLWLAFGFASWTVFASRYGTPPFLALLPLAGLVALWLGETLDGTEMRWPATVVVALLLGLIVRDYALYPDSPLRAVAADSEAIHRYCRACREAGDVLRKSGYRRRQPTGPPKISMGLLSAVSVTMARLVFGFEPVRFVPRTRVVLPLRLRVLTFRTSTPSNSATALHSSAYRQPTWRMAFRSSSTS